jgi:AcrR family transcriptional regulator
MEPMTKKIPTTIKDQELVALRRGEIIDVATRLFLERGFHKTSIRDIARACPFNLASLCMSPRKRTFSSWSPNN